MHIHSLKIQNFMGIDHLELDLAPVDGPIKTAVLAGDNGCGKSSVLLAIQAALQGEIGHGIRIGQTDACVDLGICDKFNCWDLSIKSGQQRDLETRRPSWHHVRLTPYAPWPSLAHTWEMFAATSTTRRAIIAQATSDLGFDIDDKRGLSKGQGAIFELIVAAAVTQADVMLLDDAELFLHPSWQRRLPTLLRELAPKTQFFIATHSMDVLDAVCCFERFTIFAQAACDQASRRSAG